MKMRKLKLGFASVAAVAVLAGCSPAATTTSNSGEVASHSTTTGNNGGNEVLAAVLSPTAPMKTPAMTSHPSWTSP